MNSTQLLAPASILCRPICCKTPADRFSERFFAICLAAISATADMLAMLHPPFSTCHNSRYACGAFFSFCSWRWHFIFSFLRPATWFVSLFAVVVTNNFSVIKYLNLIKGNGQCQRAYTTNTNTQTNTHVHIASWLHSSVGVQEEEWGVWVV